MSSSGVTRTAGVSSLEGEQGDVQLVDGASADGKVVKWNDATKQLEDATALLNATYLVKAAQELDIGTTLLASPGGIAIGGQGPGAQKMWLSSSGNPAWINFVPSRVGSAAQAQVYGAGYAGLATSTAGGNTLTWTYGSMSGDLTDLFVGMPVGWNGQLYLVDSIVDDTHLTVKNMDGSAVAFAGAVSAPIKIAYTVTEGTCDTAGTAVTRDSGDYFTLGTYAVNQVLINGVWYAVTTVTDQTHLTLTATAGNQAGVAYKQVCVDSSFYFSMLRLQGITGGDEDYLFSLVNVVNQGRVETNGLGAGVPVPSLVLGTGADPALPGTVNYNTAKAHLEITPTGEVRVGSYFADPFVTPGAQLGASMYTPTAELPKFAAYRYSAVAEGGAATRAILGRFGMSWAGTRRYLDIAIHNDFNAPYLQARQGNGAPLDLYLNPEGSNVVIGAGAPQLPTNATNGFFYLPITYGAPTGVPGYLPAGAAPLLLDVTNNKLWIYNGAWKGVALV